MPVGAVLRVRGRDVRAQIELAADATGGRVRSDAELPVGVALRIELDDGRRGLVVVVDERGRFDAPTAIR